MSQEEKRKVFYFLIAVVLGIVTIFLPLGLDPTIQKALAVTVFMLVMFILEPVPLAISGIAGCCLYVLTGVQPFDVSFSGFSQATTWYIFGAILIGTMVTKSGLATRMAYYIMKAAGTSFKKLLAGVLLMDFVLTFVVPSGIARVVILCTVCVGLVQALGCEKGSNVGKCLLMGVTFSAALFDKGILGGGTSVLSRGLIEKFTGESILYSKWLMMFVPFDILIILTVWFLLLKLFPPEKEHLNVGPSFIEDQLKQMGGLSSEEKRAIIIAVATGVVWLTDFIHHLSPALVGIAAGIVATLPGIGVLKEEDLKKVNFLMVIFIGCALSLGEVIIETGAADVMSNTLFSWLKPILSGENSITFAILYVYNFILHLFLGDELAVIVATMPAVLKFAGEVGLNGVLIGLLWTYATGAKIFIYQSGPLVAGYSFGYFTTKDMLKLAAITSAIQLLIITILPYWWMLFL